MAITRYSPDILLISGSPPSLVPSGRLGGRVRAAIGSIVPVIADVDTIGDALGLARLPTVCRVLGINILAPAGFTLLSVDVGVYNTGNAAVPGLSISAAVNRAYATAVSLATATNVSLLEWALQTNAAQRIIANYGQQLWQDAAFAIDPGGLLDVVLTVTTAATAVGAALAYAIFYTID